MKNILDFFGCKKFHTITRSSMPDFLHDLLMDPKNSCQAFTFTFRPVFHTVDAKILHREVRNEIRKLYNFSRRKLYIELHSEMNKNLQIHYHVIMVSSKYNLSRVTSMWRKLYGFTYNSVINDLSKWQEYINKENVFPVWYYRVG